MVANTDWYLYQFRLSLARAIQERGWEAVLVSPAGPYVRHLTGAGFPWLPLSLDRQGTRPLQELKSFLRLSAIYRQAQPDLVHHFTIKPVLYGTLAARRIGGAGVVNSITGLGYVFLARRGRGAVLRAFVRPFYRFALSGDRVRVVFEHEGDREYFLSRHLVHEAKTTVIAGVGVDLARFTPSSDPPGPPVVILAARLLWDKGTGDFVEAARQLRPRHPSARFVLVGDPDPGNPSMVPESTVKAWVEEGVVEWWGHRDDMPAVLAKGHIVTLPSYGEGVPTVLLEASASGRPIVASDTPGCREVVRHRETGLLVPVGEVEALAAAIETLLEDPDLRSRLGLEGRRWVEARFDQQLVNGRTLEIYESLIGSGGP